MYQTILTDETDAVGIVTLNRPERLNAWTPRMGAEVRHAITTFDAREDIRVIVVTGAGRAFCAGADISDEAQSDRSGGDSLVESEVPYWQMNTPIIAAMNGAAVGVGITIAMQWDFRVMAEDAKYGFVFNRRGLLPELGSTWIVPRLVGLAKAMDLLLTARIINGRQAAEMGLANFAAPAESVLDRAMDLARDIATNVAPASAALTKRLLNAFLADSDREKAEELEHELFVWTLEQEDAKEGMASFFGKRPPQWKHSKHQLPEDLLNSLN
jgi:enoyl-CoA hydratase/carnithine racemase